MVSVIISSANAAQLKDVTENITTTIGTAFEIIAIDNSDGKLGICTVYNKAAKKASYNILCFMHEDIIIEANNWGQTLADIFNNDPQIGLVGVAGAGYKSLMPSPWSSYTIDTKYINLVQHFKYKNAAPEKLYRNPGNVTLAPVACIDGVFMCTTKQVFSGIQFDEQTFKGFHLYDMDYSLNVGQKYKLAVTFDILIHHLSEGQYRNEWMADNIVLHKKWNSLLPVNIEGLDRQQQQMVEKSTFKHFVKDLETLGMPLSLAHHVLWDSNRFRKLYTRLFWNLNYYLFKSKLSRKQK